ncbi:unnamed protein product [Brugia pahangi]|uniref:FIP-RBD domain-containing protein n=1 Tax=Brugia pahangi TaxID=6280 RepID=A0A0N4TDN8_BRUPA|nr:unnamed protein product [Brugia pahangi]
MRKEMDEMQQEVKKSKQVSEELDIRERLKKSDDSLSRLETVCSTPTPPPRKRIGSEITDEILQVSLAEENKKLKKDIDMLVSLCLNLLNHFPLNLEFSKKLK